MININNALNLMNPLKAIGSFLNASTFSWISALIGAGVSLYAANKASKGADQAAATSGLSLAESSRQFNVGQANLEPYQEAGEYGLDQYMGMLQKDNLPKWGGFTAADMEQDPGYQLRLAEGYQGLDRMAAAGGERFSGKRAVGLMDYGQRMASQEFGASRGRAIQDYGMQRTEGLDRLSQWANLASTGQQAAGAMSNLGQNYASSVAGINQNIASSQMAGANAQAAGALGVGNAISQGIGAYNYQQNFDKVLSAYQAG